MDHTASVTLPGGFWVNGTHHQGAGLRSPTGHDEVYLLRIARDLTPPQWTTALLVRCLTHLGPIQPVSPEWARALTVGDREALLLHLRALTLGERLTCLLSCSNPDCQEKLDLDLRVSDLLLPPYAQPKPWHTTVLEDNGTPYVFRFRLPTGGDQETIAPLARQDPAAAVTEILQRCVDRVTVNGEPRTDWPNRLAPSLSAMIGELDPQAELLLNVTCPECGHRSTALLDTGQFFARELDHRSQHVYREVHLLAWHYHWSEAEIMGMTYRKRQIYLELLAEAVSEARG